MVPRPPTFEATRTTIDTATGPPSSDKRYANIGMVRQPTLDTRWDSQMGGDDGVDDGVHDGFHDGVGDWVDDGV